MDITLKYEVRSPNAQGQGGSQDQTNDIKDSLIKIADMEDEEHSIIESMNEGSRISVPAV